MATLYRGTSAPAFTIFTTGLVYLAPSIEEAVIFAEHPILGGNRGRAEPHILVVAAKPGPVKEIDVIVQDAVMEALDLERVIAGEARRARAERYGYLSFCHPSRRGRSGLHGYHQPLPGHGPYIEADLIKVYRAITGKEKGKYLVTTDPCVALCHGRRIMQAYVDRKKLKSGPEEVAFYDGRVPLDKVGSIEAWVEEGDFVILRERSLSH
jgi:hypothetical protein